MAKVFIFGSKKVISDLQPKLKKLEEEIKCIEKMENKVEAIIRLFQVISPLQDAGGFEKEIAALRKKGRRKRKEQVEALENLQVHVRRAGRGGINRSKEGEEVTPDNVYLGDVYGLFTKTARFWLSQKENMKKELRPEISENEKSPISNWYLINDYLCDNFVSSHTSGILKQIKVLTAA